MPEESAPEKRGRKKILEAPASPEREERVVWLPLGELHPFKGYPALRGIMPGNQPYHVRDDDPSMLQITATVKERGVRQPGLARPDPEGGYEIIAGERRHRASELAGLKDMPVIIREMSDEEAVTELVDSNIQRADVLPSERAWAYRMRLEVEKRQGERTDLTSPQNAAKFRSDDKIGKSLGISGDTLRRYVSLTELLPELLQMVDDGKIGLSPAYQLAALPKDEQALLLDATAVPLRRGVRPSIGRPAAAREVAATAVFRVERTRDYTVMSNHHLKDTGLTLKSKGLLSMMLSLPDEWNYTTRGLAAICKEGVDAIGAALRELEQAGYIERHQLRGAGGRITDTEYIIYEQPRPRPDTPAPKGAPHTPPTGMASPDTENPYLDRPDMEAPYLENS